jgi:hypothetical protein
MNVKPKMQAGAQPLPDVEDDERQRDAVDAFIARNLDVLNASIRQGRKELAEGDVPTMTIDDVIAEGRRKFGEN